MSIDELRATVELLALQRRAVIDSELEQADQLIQTVFDVNEAIDDLLAEDDVLAVRRQLDLAIDCVDDFATDVIAEVSSIRLPGDTRAATPGLHIDPMRRMDVIDLPFRRISTDDVDWFDDRTTLLRERVTAMADHLRYLAGYAGFDLLPTLLEAALLGKQIAMPSASEMIDQLRASTDLWFSTLDELYQHAPQRLRPAGQKYFDSRGLRH